MTDAHRIFATWKFDWINALMIGLEPREFRVAVCLLQFANSKTLLIFPSQARIASLLGCSERAVRRAIAEMVSGGWLEAVRPNRHFANCYRFIEPKRDAMRDLRELREDAFRGERWGKADRTEVSPPNSAGEDRSVPSGEDRSVQPDGTEVSSKHYDASLEGEHSAGSEGEVSSPRGAPFVSEALLNTRVMRDARSPESSLDQLERDMTSGRFGR